ncbi:hypothetical protein [Microbacterium sp. APC 3901]|uniref:hypothetical protein n=1 Tax=Microbacterium sp. APC 3901 TaxID=3035192 RepID=UPI0025B3D44B|nr:hypothetical protein [Microbacterium sp. APC 3901]MDN3443730.1 hypothetical protein [Microbacterium sp. APC 3901]
MRSRYLAEADRLGIAASADGQDVSLVRSLPRVVRYITKMGVRANGTDSLSRLWAAVEQGDAEALAMVHELEGAAYRRRAWTTTGVCRPLLDFDDLLRAGAV